MVAHQLQALVVITCSIFRVGVLGFALTVLLPCTMRAINPHERLAPGCHHILRRIIEPSVDEVAVEAVALANLHSVHGQHLSQPCYLR